MMPGMQEAAVKKFDEVIQAAATVEKQAVKN
jgi:hypothetical protein